MLLEVQSCENIPDIVSYKKSNPVATSNGFVLCVQHYSLMLWTDKHKVVLHTDHQSVITSMCVSSASNPYVCSCSDDKVIIWDFDDFLKQYNCNDEKPRAGHLIGVDLGPVSDCSISCNNAWLALCREIDIWIVHLEHTDGTLSSVLHHSTLEQTAQPPLFCCFSPNESNLLITADDSSTFKVWHVEEGRVVQQSNVGTWHSISFCEFVLHGSHSGHLLVGTNRGTLHLFLVSLDKTPRNIAQVSATPPAHNSWTIILNDPGDGDIKEKSPLSEDYGTLGEQSSTTPAGEDCEVGCVVFCANLVDSVPKSREPRRALEEVDDGSLRADEEDVTVASILAPPPLLIVSSNQGLAVYDCHSWDCVAFRSHSELVSKDLSLVSGTVLAGAAADGILCLLSGMATSPSPSSHLVRLACKPAHRERESELSFLSLSTPSARSPLRSKFSRPMESAVAIAYGARSSSRRTGAPASAPRPVKSSGYGAPTTRRQRFVPVINGPRKPPHPRVGGAGGSSGGAGGLLSRLDDELMRTWVPPLQQTARVSLWNDFGTAVRLASSADGQSLACSCGPGVLTVLRWGRPCVDEGVRILGHDSRVTSVCFSTDSAWLLSASSDGRTKVWDWRERRCALDIDDEDPSLSSLRQRGKASGNPDPVATARRNRGVAQAAFFYMDRFILRAVGSALELNCHRLHEQPNLNVTKAGIAGTRGWRRVRKIKFPTQEVTCFVAPNHFYSNVAVVGCANRSLHVYDVDAERFLAEVRDAHARPPHALGLATASASACARAADIVVSAAACDGAKLWDLRQARCVQKFTRHLNRAHACGISLSPCCRYLAVGSEDKCVYLYDTRKSIEYVDKILGLNEVVLDVTWNPISPRLAASALNSSIGFYSSSP